MNKRYLETIKILDRQVYNLEHHQKRVDRTIGEGVLDLASIIEPKEAGLLRCRIVYDQKSYTIEYLPYIKRKVERLKLVFCNDIEYSKKYEDREKLNELYEKREECDEILIVKGGLITDTSIANIALYDGEVWKTPKQPLLEGTMRAKLLDEEKIVAVDIRYTDIPKFQKLALMNAMIDFDIITQDNIEDMIC